MQDSNWDDLRIVLALYRCGNFASTARQLGVSQSTVSRRLSACEKRLGTMLFERTTGPLTPTTTGRKLIMHAERMELEAQAAEREISGTNEAVAGTVRITSVPLIVNHILVPALVDLRARHPALRIEFVAEPKDLNLSKREADIAIRMARPHREMRAIASKIANLSYGVYARPGDAPEKLSWIGFEDTMSDLPHARWIARQTGKSPDGRQFVAVNDAETILACLRQGIGKSLLPNCVGRRDQWLKELPSGDAPPLREVWLMVHPDLKDLARIRATSAWLKASIQAFVQI